MTKKLYLLFLMLISVEFWHISFFKPFYISQILSYVIYMFWLFYGFKKNWNNNLSLCNYKNNRAVVIILVSVFIASLNTYFFYGQSLITSVVTCRPMYTILVLPVLLKVLPHDDDVRFSLNCFFVFYSFTSILDSVFDFPIIDRASFSDIDVSSDYLSNDDFIHLLNGFVLIPLCLYYNLDYFKRFGKSTALFFSLIILIYLVALQNRSTLFISILLFGHTLFISKSKLKSVKFIKLLIVLIASYLIVNSLTIWQSLIDQTHEELGNSDYTRYLSINYFINQSSPNFLCYVFGNGLVSTRTSSYLDNLASMGIHNSDVGLVGFWNQFGLIPIVYISFMLIKCIIKNGLPLYVKYNALLILACSLTLSYFATASQILWLCLLIYGYIYNKNKAKIKTIKIHDNN